jgi:hypothetical protein
VERPNFGLERRGDWKYDKTGGCGIRYRMQPSGGHGGSGRGFGTEGFSLIQEGAVVPLEIGNQKAIKMRNELSALKSKGSVRGPSYTFPKIVSGPLELWIYVRFHQY